MEMEAVSRTSSSLDQVARAAGVSRATASRVFKGSNQVSESAREAVEKAAAALGYIPNRPPRSRSESVGVVVPQPTSRVFADPMFPRLLRGIGEELAAHGLQMVLFAPQSEGDVSRLEHYLAGGHVDAVLLLALAESDPLVVRLQSRGIPVVAGGRPRGATAVSFVDVDNHCGGRVATEHLIERGRRRIAHISGPRRDPLAGDRLQGFREATWNSGLRSDLIEHGDFDRDSGEIAMHRLLAQTHQIDAVFAASDAMAVGALWALQVVGMRVPDDVAVIGFDDTPVAAATQPPLSSVRQPIEEMGREMTRLVLTLPAVGDQTPREVMLGAELAIRGSTVSPN
jgi:DNA-binding LacI/PurR family transcriptional regulator